METKTKINKWVLLKSFFTAKEMMNKMKRQSPGWKKIFANNVTKKGLISKTCKWLIQLNIKNNNPQLIQLNIKKIKKINGPIKKWSKFLNKHFKGHGQETNNKF